MTSKAWASRRFPGEIEAEEVATALQSSLSKDGCLKEAEYFSREGAATFERPCMRGGECFSVGKENETDYHSQ